MFTCEVPVIRRGVYGLQLYQEIFELRELGSIISVIDQPRISGAKMCPQISMSRDWTRTFITFRKVNISSLCLFFIAFSLCTHLNSVFNCFRPLTRHHGQQ